MSATRYSKCRATNAQCVELCFEEKLQTLFLCKILSGVPANILEDVSAQFLPLRFRKREVIFEEGDPALAFFIVHEGIVKLYKTAINGKQFVFTLANRGDTLNASALSLGNYFLTAETITEVILLKLDTQEFLSALFPMVSHNIVKILAQRLDFEYERLLESVSENAFRRIIHALWILYHKFGDTIPITRQCLAEFSGTTVETCIRTLSRLKKEQIIIDDTKQRGKLVILSPSRLKEYLII